MAEVAIPMFHSVDQFLEWEEVQAERYELLPGGVVTMMAGGTYDHSQIASNVTAALRPQLRGRQCYVHAADAKVVSREQNTLVYPDVFVRCGERGGQATVRDDPIVVFEVLSASTAERDLTRKRLVYTGIPSIQLIVYVSQDQQRLHLVRRGVDGRFADAMIEGMDAVLDLPEIGASLTMAEIYEDTGLAAAPGDPA
jgi:Uma2 family endonuclease